VREIDTKATAEVGPGRAGDSLLEVTDDTVVRAAQKMTFTEQHRTTDLVGNQIEVELEEVDGKLVEKRRRRLSASDDLIATIGEAVEEFVRSEVRVVDATPVYEPNAVARLTNVILARLRARGLDIPEGI
jgi:hypothetical protein